MSDKQEQPQIDWTNDEAVVCAVYTHARRERLGGTWFVITANRILASGENATWAFVRRHHPLVQDFERLHNPAYAPLAEPADGAEGEAHEPQTFEEFAQTEQSLQTRLIAVAAKSLYDRKDALLQFGRAAWQAAQAASAQGRGAK